MFNRSTFEYLLNAGRIPSQTHAEELAHIRVITATTFLLLSMGAIMVIFHGIFGIIWVSLAVSIAMLFGLVNFYALFRFDCVEINAQIMMAIIFATALVSNMIWGGYYDPNFLWLMLMPILAAFLISFRAMWIYVGLLLICMLGFIYLENIKVLPLYQVHTQDYQAATAINRFGLLIFICLAVQLFYQQRLRYEKKITTSARKMRKANQERDEFLANITHELKTPLTGIMGMTELLLKTKQSDNQKYYVQNIHESSTTLLQLMNDILDYAKINRGTLTLYEEAFDLRLAVESTLNLLAKGAYDKNLALSYYTQPDLPPLMIGDELRYKQILRNLLSNAIKFTDEGEINIRVTYEDTGTGSLIITTHVKDTGIGISKANLAKIFKSYTQLKQEHLGRLGGTGLGLSISEELAHMMGGDIHVDSTLGKGSDFCFTCRFSRDVAQTQELQKPPPLLTHPHTALCIGLSEADQELICQSLENWNIRCIKTNAVIIALNMIKEKISTSEAFDFIILEHDAEALQPTLDILTLLSHQDYKTHIIELHRQTDSPQLSGNSRGLIHHLQKPIRGSALYEIILNACSESLSQSDDSTTQAEELPHFKGHILVAEDNVINQALIKAQLDTSGITFDMVSNGQEALEKLDHHPYDLVIMDYHMPILDGVSCAKKIRSSKKDYKCIPIIALTADLMTDEHNICMEAGMNDFITKPFKQRDFIAVLNKWLLKEKKSND